MPQSSSNVIMHIAGPSGSGKSTLLKEIEKKFPSVTVADLDDFGDDAEKNLELDTKDKDDYTDEEFDQVHDETQRLLDEFIEDHDNIVLGGHHTEDDFMLEVPTKNKFMLKVSPTESALRALKRDPDTRSIEDLPFDIKEAEEVVKQLKDLGYKPASPKQILRFLKHHLS